MTPISFYILSCIFLVSGISHFVTPFAYIRMIPTWIPSHKAIVYTTGFLEIILAIMLLIPEWQFFSTSCIFCLLCIYLLIHIRIVYYPISYIGIPKWILYFRLLIQILLLLFVFNLLPNSFSLSLLSTLYFL